jgi:diguanylate cyclase (GGDEF)-like protein
MKEESVKAPHRFVAAAGSLGVAEEIVTAAGGIFGEYMVGIPRVITDPLEADEADLFLCFASRIPELAKRIPEEKIRGINMVPTHHFCLTLNTIPENETRWVFCNSHNSAQVIIDYCEQFGLPVHNFAFATYEDTPDSELLNILRQATCIVGVTPMVGAGGVLATRYRQYLNDNCRIVIVKRVLSTESIAVIYRWILNLNCQLEKNIQAKNKSLESALRKMNKIQKQLEYESTHDSLTGCYNRRYFETALRRIDGNKPDFMALTIMDMDGLKPINDTFGHDEGDAVLARVGKLLRGCFRQNDIVARIGGDEFAAILPNTPEATLLRIIARVNDEVKVWANEEKRYSINISLGYSSTEPESKSATQLFKEADTTMYLEKTRRKASE